MTFHSSFIKDITNVPQEGPKMSLKPKLDPNLKAKLRELTFDEQRRVIGIFLKTGSGGRLWDLLTGLRGPDSPSEKPGDYNSPAYKARRARKYDTVEVIREAAFFGVVGGSARSHQGSVVKLPQPKEFDHFDKHVDRAASAIGLGVEYKTPQQEPNTTNNDFESGELCGQD